MKRVQLIGVFAVLGTVVLHAMPLQSEAAKTTNNVTVAGCVTQAERTGSLADDTGAGIASTPATAPVDANSAQPVNAYLLTNAPDVSQDGKSPDRATPTSYALVGHEQELAKHKGHQVEITGRLLPPRSPAGTTAGQGAAPSIQRIQVGAVKMVSADCPVRKP